MNKIFLRLTLHKILKIKRLYVAKFDAALSYVEKNKGSANATITA